MFMIRKDNDGHDNSVTLSDVCFALHGAVSQGVRDLLASLIVVDLFLSCEHFMCVFLYVLARG